MHTFKRTYKLRFIGVYIFLNRVKSVNQPDVSNQWHITLFLHNFFFFSPSKRNPLICFPFTLQTHYFDDFAQKKETNEKKEWFKTTNELHAHEHAYIGNKLMDISVHVSVYTI